MGAPTLHIRVQTGYTKGIRCSRVTGPSTYHRSHAVIDSGLSFLSFTGANGATATVTFAGDAVVVYGGTSFDHGNYTVSLDGAQQQQFNGGSDGQSRMYYPQVRLYLCAFAAMLMRRFTGFIGMSTAL